MGCSCMKEAPVIVTRRGGNMTYGEYRNRTTGRGCKQTPAWQCFVSPEELIKKREEYWSTRLEGSPEAWQTIKAAIEEKDDATAAAILKAADLNMANNTIQDIRDRRNRRYIIPLFVIHEPESYNNDKQRSAIAAETISYKTITLKIRLAGIINDEEFNLNTSTSVGSLKEMYAQKISKQAGELRFFYGGKELNENNNLAQEKIEDGTIMSATLRPKK